MSNSPVDGPNDRGARGVHRALQGRWRAEVLQRPPGPPTDPRARSRYATLVSGVPESFEGISAAEEGLNLMSPPARAYARDRLQLLGPLEGLAEPDRLWRNMLSSQPLAFSIAGEFRARPESAATVFREMTGYPVAALATLDDTSHRLEGIEAEWFPPRDLHTGDRSGFDIAPFLRLEDESTLLLTVEVKYVDTFSRAKLDPARYADALAATGIDPAEARRIVDSGGSQFLRSVLLTDSVRRHGIRGEGGVDQALAVVLARHDDRPASKVVSLFEELTLGSSVALWSHRDLFQAATNQPHLETWAQQMQRRYLAEATPASPMRGT
jgi:hypothetical protein